MNVQQETTDAAKRVRQLLAAGIQSPSNFYKLQGIVSEHGRNFEQKLKEEIVTKVKMHVPEWEHDLVLEELK